MPPGERLAPLRIRESGLQNLSHYEYDCFAACEGEVSRGGCSGFVSSPAMTAASRATQHPQNLLLDYAADRRHVMCNPRLGRRRNRMSNDQVSGSDVGMLSATDWSATTATRPFSGQDVSSEYLSHNYSTSVTTTLMLETWNKTLNTVKP